MAMVTLESAGFPDPHLDCYESAVMSILRYMGLPEETPLMGTQAYFVLERVTPSISPRFNRVNEEWERVHGLTINALHIADDARLRDEITANLGDGRPVCLPVDVYFLAHTSHYNRLHQCHFVNLFGYDHDRYYVICPYYRFKGWLDQSLIHASFFSPTIEDRRLIFIHELKVEELSPARVHDLARESCQNMLGLAVPEALTGMEPRYLGLSGIRAFSDLLQELVAKQDEGLSREALLDLSRQLMTVGNSRYWFRRLIQACQHCLLSVDKAADLQEQFTGVAQSWRTVGLRLGASVHANRYEMIERAALQLKRVYLHEYRLFNSLLEALPNYEGGIL